MTTLYTRVELTQDELKDLHSGDNVCYHCDYYNDNGHKLGDCTRGSECGSGLTIVLRRIHND